MSYDLECFSQIVCKFAPKDLKGEFSYDSLNSLIKRSFLVSSHTNLALIAAGTLANSLCYISCSGGHRERSNFNFMPETRSLSNGYHAFWLHKCFLPPLSLN